MTETLEEKCRRLEHFETPQWAVDAILKRIDLGQVVIDPCAGTGILVKSAQDQGARTIALDVEDWGFPLDGIGDFFDYKESLWGKTVFMNPPFKYADKFVEHSFNLGADRVLTFQRLAWLESRRRRDFWKKFSPLRIYLCGERASCWRHDISQEERERRGDTPTPHAWFFFTRNSLGRGRPEFRMLYKDGEMV